MMVDKIDLLRRTLTAIAKEADGNLLTGPQCETLSALSEYLHDLSEAAWNRRLAVGDSEDD